jgi:hypothetical protein
MTRECKSLCESVRREKDTIKMLTDVRDELKMRGEDEEYIVAVMNICIGNSLEKIEELEDIINKKNCDCNAPE